jgi:hypothetical protein
MVSVPGTAVQDARRARGTHHRDTEAQRGTENPFARPQPIWFSVPLCASVSLW